MNYENVGSINILDNVNAEIYASHIQEWFRLGRNTSDEFILFYPNRFSIDNARNQAALHTLRNECDFLYFIDDDIVLSPTTYQSLKKGIEIEGADIVQALTFIRGYPFHAMMFKRSNIITALGGKNLDYYDDYKEHVDENGYVECDAVGFSCVLIKCDVLKKINPPYFVPAP